MQHKARAWNVLGLSAWIIKERRNNIKINYVKGTERRDSEISFYFICINTHCQRISWMTHTFTFVINAGASCFTHQPAGNNMRISLWNQSRSRANNYHYRVLFRRTTNPAAFKLQSSSSWVLNWGGMSGRDIRSRTRTPRGLFRCAAVVIAVSSPPHNI